MKQNLHLIAVAMGLISLGSPASVAQVNQVVTRVEEDWRVYVVEPDSQIGVPHIANFIAPNGTDTSIFGLIELNHGSQPDFTSGGCQVQGWIGETLVSYAETDHTDRLRLKYDRVEYTVSLETSATSLKIALSDGKSKTWGRFARTPIMTEIPVPNPSLANYSPDVSVANTSINHGANRVALMYMTGVRYYNGNTLITKDATPRVLHRFRDSIQYVSLEEYEANTEFYNISIDE